MSMTFTKLREQHPKFIYHSFKLEYLEEGLKISFFFSIDPDIEFHPYVIFPNITSQIVESIGIDIINNLAFNLGLIELISYWKATCSPTIVIKAGSLTPEQISWWKHLYKNGLGEFFYLNQIDFSIPNLMDIQIDSNQQYLKHSQDLTDQDLVLIGGGKDSAVTVEVFKHSDRPFNLLQLNPTQASIDIASQSQIPTISIKRVIDKQLLELNSKGYLNGHTPFSAYLAFLSTLAGVLYDFKNIIVSNESSANEGNIKWKEMEINHQYSKTFEFESQFRDYSLKYLSSQTNYFSFLRPLTELQIAKIFSQFTKYHTIFRSCNKGSKQNIWCGECPKCLFAFIILYPFLEDKVVDIFGHNLLEKPDMILHAKNLQRKDDQPKSFECVGMAAESKLAFFLIVQLYQQYNLELPVVLQAVMDQLLDSSTNYDTLQSELLNGFSENNFLSERYLNLLKEYL